MKFLLLFLVFSCSSFKKSPSEMHLVTGCRIFSMSGELLRNYPGQYCLFLDDGSFISASALSLRRFNSRGEIIWEIPGHFHHQINFTTDQKKLLALTSIVTKKDKKVIREDKFLVLNLDGEILHQTKTSDIFGQTGSQNLNWEINPGDASIVGEGIETSHFNSFYEIPAVSLEDPPPYLKEGNYILNGVSSGVFILDEELKKVLHHFIFRRSRDHQVHDVQVNSKGHYVYFNNLVQRKFQNEKIRSSILEVHPITREVIHRYDAKDKPFFSKVMSSVQELGSDKWLFTHYLNGTYIYSKSEKEIISRIPATHIENGRPVPKQQTKAFDLTSFLKRNPGF